MSHHLKLLQGCANKLKVIFGLIALMPFTGSHVFAVEPVTPLTLPLITTDSLEYIGGFRIPIGTFGDSSAAYAEGPITMGPNGSTIFLVGHSQQQSIAEFQIPELSSSNEVLDLNIASVVQPFVKIFERPNTGNPQNMNRIGGMEYLDGELIVNTYEYYDAAADAEHTTLVVRDARNLGGSAIDGYHSYQAKAHASGWISPIPPNLQSQLGGTHISGHSSGKPIIGRHSVGPSAFAINPVQDIIGGRGSSSIPTGTLLDFSLESPLGASGASSSQILSYLLNSDTTNDLWTHKSRASYGFIIPGTRTYMTIGYSGGHESGIGYKITQDDGTLCGGYCSNLVVDNYNYYWLWDVNDLIEVKNGHKNAFEIMPFSYGKFDTPFQTAGFSQVIGGAIDSIEGTLYLVLSGADKKQSQFSPLPIIVSYKLPVPPASPSDITIR